MGKLPLKTKETIQTLIDHQWGNKLIRSWNELWLDLPNRLANKLARLIGAKSNEVIIGESTSTYPSITQQLVYEVELVARIGQSKKLQ